MDEDPFSAFSDLTEALFPILHNDKYDKYTNPPVQQLKEAVGVYEADKNTNTFIKLLKAIRGALIYIAKEQKNLTLIDRAMNKLAEIHKMPTIEWTQPTSSPRFPFSTSNQLPQSDTLFTQQDDLTQWILHQKKKVVSPKHQEIVQSLIENCKEQGFSQKLREHLNKDPNFLFDLIMKSEENFVAIVKSRLIFYLTDIQLATAIREHANSMMHKIEPLTDSEEPFSEVTLSSGELTKITYDQVTLFVDELNKILSNGRSVQGLLRNTEAVTILKNVPVFQIYESEEYQNRSASGAPSL